MLLYYFSTKQKHGLHRAFINFVLFKKISAYTACIVVVYITFNIKSRCENFLVCGAMTHRVFFLFRLSFSFANKSTYLQTDLCRRLSLVQNCNSLCEKICSFVSRRLSVIQKHNRRAAGSFVLLFTSRRCRSSFPYQRVALSAKFRFAVPFGAFCRDGTT